MLLISLRVVKQTSRRLLSSKGVKGCPSKWNLEGFKTEKDLLTRKRYKKIHVSGIFYEIQLDRHTVGQKEKKIGLFHLGFYIASLNSFNFQMIPILKAFIKQDIFNMLLTICDFNLF